MVVCSIKIDIAKVELNRGRPRKKFDEDALLELAESIKQFGVLQPLLVQERDDYYEIIKELPYEYIGQLDFMAFLLMYIYYNTTWK